MKNFIDPLILHGFSLGLFLALPAGGTAIIIIREIWFKGPLLGFFASLAPVTVDVLCAFLVAYAVSFVETVIAHHQQMLFLIAALALGVIAVIIFKTHQDSLSEPLPAHHVYRKTLRFASVNFLTLPLGLLILLPSFGGFETFVSFTGTVWFISGMACGSIFLWLVWITLITLAKKFGPILFKKKFEWLKENITPQKINKIFSGLIFCFALVFVYKAFH